MPNILLTQGVFCNAIVALSICHHYGDGPHLRDAMIESREQILPHGG
jgi:hypothetical protein